MKKDKSGLIIFDCFGTLLNPPKNKAYKRFFDRINIPLPYVYDMVLTNKDIDWGREIYKINPFLNVKDDWIEDLQYDLKMENMDVSPYPNTFEILELLRKDFTIVLLSNLAQGYEEPINNLLTEHMDKTFYSFDIGVKKPDIESFQCVVDWYHENLTLSNKNIFMVDDKLANVLQGQSLGFGSYLIHKNPIKNEISYIEDISEFERAIYEKSQL